MKRGPRSSKALAWPVVVRPARRTKLLMVLGWATPSGALPATGAAVVSPERAASPGAEALGAVLSRCLIVEMHPCPDPLCQGVVDQGVARMHQWG